MMHVGPKAASLLGNVGKTTVSGTVTEGVRTPISLPVGEDIFGPFEAGFSSQQNNVLSGLGCSPASLGYLPGGLDTDISERIVANACNIALPRYHFLISFFFSCNILTYSNIAVP